MMSAPKKVLVAHKPPEKIVVKAGAGQAGRQGHAAQAGRRHRHRPSGRRRSGAGRRTGRGQGSQIGQAVLQLGRRSGQEEGHPDPWRRHGRRGPQQLARRPAWPPRQRARPSRRPGASRTGRSARDRSARARNHHGRRAGAQDGRQGLRSDQVADEDGPDGHHQPAAGPGHGHDRGRGNGPQGHHGCAGRPGSLHRRRRRRDRRRSRCRARRW